MMPAQTIARNLSGLQTIAHNRFSLLVTTTFALIGLLMGWQLKFGVENSSETVFYKGVVAQAPQGWLAQQGAGDLAFLVRDPFRPRQRYGVYQLPATDSLRQIAVQRGLAWGRANDSFRTLDETPIILDGETGYKVHYAYIDLRSTGMPAVTEGVSYYFYRGGKVTLIYYENEQASFDKGLSRFRKFMDTVQIGGGG